MREFGNSKTIRGTLNDLRLVHLPVRPRSYEWKWITPHYKKSGASAAARAYVSTMTLVLINPPSPFDTLATWQRHLADVRRLSDDTLLKAELIKTAKEAIESRTNRSYLPDTRAGGLQCRSSLHGHDHSRHRWGIDLYLGRR